MKKALKILATILILLVIALIAIPYFYKEEIAQFIKDDINRNLNAVVDYDDISLSLIKDFPNLEIKLDNLTVDGVGEFKEVRLVSLKNLNLSLNAKKVFLDKDFEIKKLHINKLDLNVLVNKAGKANYAIVKETNKDEKAQEEKGFELKLKEYTITETNIKYQDLSSGMSLELMGIEHKGNGKITDLSYLLNTKTEVATANFTYGTKYLDRAKLQLISEILIEEDFTKYSFQNPKLQLNNLDISFDKSLIWLQDEDILIDFAFKTQNTLKQLLSLAPKEYLKNIENVDANGHASLTGMVNGTYNAKNYPAYSFKLKVKNGTLKYPDLPESLTDINIDTKVDFAGGSNLDRTRIDLSNIHLLIADNSVDGKLKINNPMSDPLIDADFKSNLDLNKLKNAVVLPGVKQLNGTLDANFKLKGKLSAIENKKYNNFKASGYFNLDGVKYQSDSIPYTIMIPKATVDVTPKALVVKNMDSNIGDNDFHINGNITNYIAYFLHKDQVLKADFNMHSKQLNLNDFMASDTTKTNTSTTGGVLQIPKNIAVNFKASADKLQYDDMQLTDVKGTLKVKDQKADFSAVLLKTLDGQMKLNGSYDTTKETPKSFFDVKMEKMSIVKSANTLSTFKTYAPILQKIKGNFFSDMKLDVQLDKNMNPIMNSLSAKGSFDTANIQLKGIDIVKKIGNLLKIDALKKPTIDNIKARYTIKDGVMKIKPFAFKLNTIKSGLSGSVNLNKQINFVLSMDIPKKMLGANPNLLLEGLVGKLSKLGLNVKLGDIIKMKFKISGDYDHPKITPVIAGYEGNSTQEIITEIVEDKIEEVVDNAVDQAKIKAKAQADKIMAQAQQQADSLVSKAQQFGNRLKSEAKTQGNNLIDKTTNPFQKLAAKATAKQLNKQADKEAKALVNKAQTQADKLLNTARKKSEKLLQTEVDVFDD